MDRQSQETRKAQHPVLRWHGFPREIQYAILELLACGHRRSARAPSTSEATNNSGRLATYAVVCRDWQAFFEAILFRRLMIRQQDLPEFGRLRPCRRGLVHHLWLRVELPSYDCSMCRQHETAKIMRKHNPIIRKAFCDLFAILNNWGERTLLDADSQGRGLTLEISVHSPSDSEHCFKNISFDHLSDEDDVCVLEDATHGWVGGRRTFQPGRFTTARIFGNSIYVNPRKRLPAVRVVKHLLIRRQTRRHFWHTTMRHIMRSLPELDSVRLEIWKRPSRGIQAANDAEFFTTFSKYLPKQVRSFVLFEDFNQDYDSWRLVSGIHNAELVRTPYQPLARWLAGSRKLQSLSASFIVDAKHYLDAVRHRPEDGPWQNLTQVSLTSLLLKWGTSSDETEGLLLAAASAAHQMPQLKMLELWYGRRGQACLFRYSVLPCDATEIFCSGTWDLELQSGVVEAWRLVSRSDFRVRKATRIDADLIQSHGDAIHHLGLMLDVLHPESLRQIRRDARKS
ncbi:hypothetical protein TOPH_04909 [Tolypocladium ophioglossoides CBS 100239]|uniref:DUF6546 domain-containing protein n=1 Tax=Tolypocladium ophioglossoides (strain CBS 100239) TaxID=1163406 RepID=A0A0L0N8N7_TOLOC|nr:hypothetical protein TOPH_04909 [Tolypocladium ophioglossoides CBS 100239]